MTDDAVRDLPLPAGLDAVLRRMIAAREAALGDAEAHIAARNRRIDELDALVTAVQAALDGEIAHIRERNRRIGELDAEIAARDRRIEHLEDQVARLHRLAEELVWPEGPRALRAVLPMARLVRRVIRR
ncbi:hypothetical protein [Acidiphilium acidophilum]|uniref:Uncharacterized protein n=1 Tax=Acidiphilium acidophilum TaxID=76588 RepID=A0AAW9DQ77_ACIAO|nr:hypothetical protein [Acidiphilium acidophilum]MDX5930885.1 hypothetical protein [Acidiphilium acidophilum]